MGRDSQPEGRGFESKYRILEGHFITMFVVKSVILVGKRPKINEEEAGVGSLKVLVWRKPWSNGYARRLVFKR